MSGTRDRNQPRNNSGDSTISTTIALMPFARSVGTSAFTVSASSRNSYPAMPAGNTISGTPFSASPMNATGMPPNRFTT